MLEKLDSLRFRSTAVAIEAILYFLTGVLNLGEIELLER